MIRVQRLEKGTYFDNAYMISFRYDPRTVAKVKELAQRRYLRRELGRSLIMSYLTSLKRWGSVILMQMRL